MQPGNEEQLPSTDEPESTQALQIPRVDPELEDLIEQEEARRTGMEQTADIFFDLALQETAAESLPPQNLQDIVDVLSGYLQRYAGSDRASFYNALRVIAEATGTQLPVKIMREIAIPTPGIAIARLQEIDNDYRKRHNGRSIPIFGPVAWDPASIEWCQLVDGTEFICFNHPSRDPAKDR